MADVPIIFSAAMVAALLAGRKTMTRRLLWVPRNRKRPDAGMKMSNWRNAKAGDCAWVRENLSETDKGWVYSADGAPIEMAHDDPRIAQMIGWAHHNERDYCPSIHMPRWASRITLDMTANKIERLNAISPEDAINEGLHAITKDSWRTVKYGLPDRDGEPGNDDLGWPWEDWRISPVDAFANLWNQVHGAGAWLDNPEVVAPTFTVRKENIDIAVKEAA